jgi:serine/threonine protein phosphatase PrpC
MASIFMTQGKRDNIEDHAVALNHVHATGTVTCLTAVIDGVGGNAGGEVASATASSAMTSFFLSQAERLEHADHEKLAYFTRDCLLSAHQAVRQLQSHPSLSKASATCIVAIEQDGRVTLAWTGDCCGMVFFDGQLHSLTLDHNRAVQARIHGQPEQPSNIVLQALGSNCCPHIRVIDLSIGSHLILCSDGLVDTLDLIRIRQIVADAGDEREVAQNLVTVAAPSAGDNVSVCVHSILTSSSLTAVPTIIATEASLAFERALAMNPLAQREVNWCPTHNGELHHENQNNTDHFPPATCPSDSRPVGAAH